MRFYLATNWVEALGKQISEVKRHKEKDLNAITSELFIDPVELAPYYVEPNCQPYNPADVNEEANDSGFQMPITKYLAHFISTRVVYRDGSNQLFILSDAGMGKTSLLAMFKLAHINSFWPKGYHCTVFRLDGKVLDKIRRIEERRNMILLLDALDEDTSAIGRIEDRLIEILTETSNFKKVIITCRTQFFPTGETDPFQRQDRVKLRGFSCPVVYLSPFDEEKVQEYLSKRHPRSWFEKLFKKEQNNENMNDIVLRMGSLKTRPILLAHIDYLLDIPDLHENIYKLYRALIDVWLDREVRKSHHLGKESIKKENLLSACWILATKMQSSLLREISLDDIKDLGVDQRHDLELLDISGRSLLNRNSDGNYRFAHYSIQEFLVASRAVEDPHFEFTEEIPKTDLIEKFLIAADEQEINPKIKPSKPWPR